MDFSEEQPENNPCPICFNLELRSNVRLSSEEQRVKQPFARISTEEGIQIECSEEQFKNASRSI
jgi:hypothetical protein